MRLAFIVGYLSGFGFIIVLMFGGKLGSPSWFAVELIEDIIILSSLLSIRIGRAIIIGFLKWTIKDL